MAYHARLGPSGAYIWMACTASPGESDGKPNEGNDASRMGTACHGVASVCLISGKQPEAYLDQSFIFGKDKTGDRQEDLACYLSVADLTVEYELPITEEYVEHVNAYVAYVRDVHATVGGQMFIEQRVPIDHITGEPGAGGTSDTIIIAGDTAWVIDAKFGRNKVVAMEMVKPALPHPITGDMEQPVYAPNSQLAMYASGALRKHDPFGLVSIIRLVIVQPPLHHVSEYAMTVSDLDAFIDHGDAVRNMVLHRADSHGLFWLTLGAPLLAWLAHRLSGPAGGFRRWWLAMWLALVTHPLLDTMTVYGTPEPPSRSSVALNALPAAMKKSVGIDSMVLKREVSMARRAAAAFSS